MAKTRGSSSKRSKKLALNLDRRIRDWMENHSNDPGYIKPGSGKRG